MTTHNNIYTINNLHFSYGSEFKINLSMKIPQACSSVIIGPNGSGKTTILKLLARILPVQKGEIKFNTTPLAAYNRQELAKKVAFVRQHSPSSLKGITGKELVALGRIPFRKKFQIFDSAQDSKIIEQSMALTDSLSFADRLTANLSGGELKRLLIAKALAQEPETIILDEPTNHLDLHHQIKMLDLLKKLKEKRKLTIIMTLHDLNIASEYAEQIYLLNNGSLHDSGKPEDIINWKNIEEVYKTPVIVQESPLSKKPCVFFLSADTMDKWQKKA